MVTHDEHSVSRNHNIESHRGRIGLPTGDWIDVEIAGLVKRRPVHTDPALGIATGHMVSGDPNHSLDQVV